MFSLNSNLSLYQRTLLNSSRTFGDGVWGVPLILGFPAGRRGPGGGVRTGWTSGPDVMSGAEIFQRIATLDGRHVPTLGVPFLTPSLSSWWLKLITRGDFGLSRELVQGFTSDLLPRDDRYWSLIDAPPRQRFEEAVRQALKEERTDSFIGALEENVVGLFGRVLAQRRRVRP